MISKLIKRETNVTTLCPSFSTSKLHLNRDRNFYRNKRLAEEFFRGIEKSLEVRCFDDWYKVTEDQVLKFYSAKKIISAFGNLPYALLKAFPEYEWEIWRFQRVPTGYWTIQNQRKFFDSLGKHLGFHQFEDWYKITYDNVIKYGGSSILTQYDHSVPLCLKDTYPEHIWKTWRFLQVPKHYWEDFNNVLEVLRDIESELNIKSFEEWNRIPRKMLVDLGLGTLLAAHGGIVEVLNQYYPVHKWSAEDRQSRSRSSQGQQILFNFVGEIFPSEEIHMNHVIERDQKNHRKILEVDIYLPSLSLAFEYQGIQHYGTSEFLINSNETDLKTFDQWKRRRLEELNIRLIEVPYWWDFKKESLIGSIIQQKKDLVKSISTSTSTSIPINI